MPSSVSSSSSRPRSSQEGVKKPRSKRAATRTYVLDTSVLLSDPRALERFDEHEVVLPVVVLTELETKRNHPELGWAARRALRTFEELRLAHGSLTMPLPVNERGGTMFVSCPGNAVQ